MGRCTTSTRSGAMADVTVLGAGVAGLWAAGTLSQAGLSVRLLDRRKVSARSLMALPGAAYALDTRFAEAEVVEAGADLRPGFADYVPRVVVRGRVAHLKGLFHHGYLIAPALARQAVDWITRGVGGDLVHVDQGQRRAPQPRRRDGGRGARGTGRGARRHSGERRVPARRGSHRNRAPRGRPLRGVGVHAGG